MSESIYVKLPSGLFVLRDKQTLTFDLPAPPEGGWPFHQPPSDEPKLPYFISACPKCGEGFELRGGEGHTLVGYHSPKGHDHDDNCYSCTFVCKKGHETRISKRRRCWCGWVGKQECFCHKGLKVDEYPSASRDMTLEEQRKYW